MFSILTVCGTDYNCFHRVGSFHKKFVENFDSESDYIQYSDSFEFAKKFVLNGAVHVCCVEGKQQVIKDQKWFPCVLFNNDPDR